MATFRRFEDIEAWVEARELVKIIYNLTGQEGFGRDYGLRDQTRRAAVSIMANIAEGYERDGNSEFSQFLSIAKASAGEVRSHLYVALDAGYLSAEGFRVLEHRAMRVSVLITRLMAYLRTSGRKGRKYPDPALFL